MSEEDWEDWEAEVEEASDFGAAGADSPSLSLAFLAVLPLLVAYEFSQAAGVGARNTSELVLLRVPETIGLAPAPTRWVALALLSILALVLCFRRRIAVLPQLFRIFLEGLGGAVLLTPALVLAMGLLGMDREALRDAAVSAGAPGLATASLSMGGAAYEELLFRVFGYSVFFLAGRELLRFLGASGFWARWGGELFGLGLSSLAFAAFHLAAFTSWLGRGGEDFSPLAFTWRLLAGLSLGIIFRWRGPGVAAWTHGLFNLALLLGAGPESLLG